MPRSCICYTTDQHYLLPTLVSAVQARFHAPPEAADVAIFAFQVDLDVQQIFRTVCDAEGIIFRSVEHGVIEYATAMLSRLFLNRFAPAGYSRYLYIDSDVQISGSLSGLLDVDLPSGRFMAANDPVTFFLPDATGEARAMRAYFSSIGLDAAAIEGYFNSGILLISRDGWDEVGLRAWRLFRERGKSFRFPDQDVLNLAAGDYRVPMSLAWNFPVFMRNSRVEREIRPHVFHFMSQPKPWQGAYPPWNAAASMPYTAIIGRYPSLAPFATVMPLRFHLRYHLQQRFKMLVETMEWALGERRNRILAYERACQAGESKACLAQAGSDAAG